MAPTALDTSRKANKAGSRMTTTRQRQSADSKAREMEEKRRFEEEEKKKGKEAAMKAMMKETNRKTTSGNREGRAVRQSSTGEAGNDRATGSAMSYAAIVSTHNKEEAVERKPQDGTSAESEGGGVNLLTRLGG